MSLDLRETSLGFYRAWHAGLGARHGLLHALRDAPRAPDALADETGLDAAAVALWCEGAWAVGLLTRDRKHRYRLAREHRATLGDPTSTEYLGHHFEYLTQKSLTFADLDGLFRGRAGRRDLAQVYAIATRWDHVASFDAMPAALRRALAEGIDVLDLGAGEGGWTREAMRRYPRSRFSAAEPDTRTLRGLRGAKVVRADRVPAAAFDLVLLGEVLTAAAEPRAVLAAAHRALRPGGHLFAMEGLRPPASRAPRDWGERLVLAMGLDLSTDGSRFLSLAQLQAAIREASFPRAKVRDLGGSLFAIVARKA